MRVDFFPTDIYFSAIFDFNIRENPCFHDEFQALQLHIYKQLQVHGMILAGLE